MESLRATEVVHAAAGGRHVALLSRQGELWTAGAAMQVESVVVCIHIHTHTHTHTSRLWTAGAAMQVDMEI